MFIYKRDIIAAIALGFLGSIFLFLFSMKITPNKIERFLSPITMAFQPLKPLEEPKKGKEVFGFLPYWNANKVDTIDFSVLTTLAHFDLKATAEGEIIKDDAGYESFQSKKMTEVFKEAHNNGTRVVATLTMMDGPSLEQFIMDPNAQDKLIDETVTLVQQRGIDGVNIDFEYFGQAGAEYKPKFTAFVKGMTDEMHALVPGSQVSVALYASVVKSPRMYDLASIADSSDIIFMMAYDFATLSSKEAMPTAPLYGHNKKKWWYDVSTAVDDFLALMPAEKLVLGNPWYNNNYAVTQPEIKAATLSAYYGKAEHLTYASEKAIVHPDMPGITNYTTGWDEDAQVSWKAYKLNGVWRMSFVEDERSMRAKYDFAQSRNLAGVGMWALGNEGNNPEMWSLLREKFGSKLADSTVASRTIQESI